MGEKKLCRKCGKPLAKNCKDNICERCMNKNAGNIKKAAGIGAAVASVGGIALAVIKGVLHK